jgi:recombination protein RecR
VEILPLSLRKVIRELKKLPSLGEKTASRLAYHLVYRDRELAIMLAKVLNEAVDKVKSCSNCYSLTDEDLCIVCKDQNRDVDLICVVEKPLDIAVIERSGEFSGTYHVLHGLWSPLSNRDISDLKLIELFNRIERDKVKEVIIATGATLEGDATALYILSELEKLNVTVSRLAQGMPKGGELEYADELTLAHAFVGRRNLK